MSECSLKEKLTSGRRFLVVVSGIVLLGLSACVGWRLSHVFRDPQMLAVYVALFGQIITLIGMVYKDYFARDRSTDSNGIDDGVNNGGNVPPVK